MSRINLSEKRGIGDSITTTFSFVKQEFVPLVKVFGMIVLPLILLGLCIKSFVVLGILNTLANLSESGLDVAEKELTGELMAGIVYIWVQLMVVAYLRVYREKFRAGDEKRVTSREVWKLMRQNLVKGIGWCVLYTIIICIGVVLLIIPGIYMSIAMVFAIFFMLVRNKSIDVAMSDSMAMVKHRWWNTFFYVFVIFLIVSILTYIFDVPYVIVQWINGAGANVIGNFGLTFSLMLSDFGGYVLQTILAIGLGVRFFSLLEEQEHETLLNKIDRLGQDTPDETNEDEGER